MTTPKIVFHDTTDGTFPAVTEVYQRFLASAEDAGVPRRDADLFWYKAVVEDDRTARDLIAETTGCELL